MHSILLFVALSVLSVMYLWLALHVAPFFAGYVAGMLSAVGMFRLNKNPNELRDMAESKGRFSGLDITKYGFKHSFWTVLYLVFWPVSCIIEGIVMAHRFLKDDTYFPQ